MYLLTVHIYISLLTCISNINLLHNHLNFLLCKSFRILKSDYNLHQTEKKLEKLRKDRRCETRVKIAKPNTSTTRMREGQMGKLGRTKNKVYLPHK